MRFSGSKHKLKLHERECGWKDSIPANERHIPQYDAVDGPTYAFSKSLEYKKHLYRVGNKRSVRC